MTPLRVLLLLVPVALAKEYAFPIVLPPYGQEGASPSARKPEWGSCMLYLESLSVLVFNPASKEISSAAATVNGGSSNGNKFTFDNSYAACLRNGSERAGKKGDEKARQFSFNVEVTVNDAAKAVRAKEAAGEALFTVSGPIKLLLTFEVKPDNTWSLTSVKATALKVTKGSWLSEDLTLADAEGKRVELARIAGGTPSIGYACASTPAVIFDPSGGSKDYTIGIAFNNLQVQPSGVWFGQDKEQKAVARFGRNVNDCVGTFSAGSWMGVVVFALLLFVLLLSYLMLNSVQTMDRFDDPKQKQIIISAKE